MQVQHSISQEKPLHRRRSEAGRILIDSGAALKKLEEFVEENK